MYRKFTATLAATGLGLLAGCADNFTPAESGPASAGAPIAEIVTANSVTRIVGNWQVTITDLGTLPGGTFSTAYDINNLGEIVGVATDAGGVSRRVIWNNGAIVDTLPQPSSAGSIATQMNESRQLVGFARQGSGGIGYGVFWNHGTAVKLQPLPGTAASGAAANGINASGDVAGGGTGGGGTTPLYQHAGIWRNGLLLRDIGVISGGNFSMAYDINDAGQVTGTGTAGGTGARQYAFVWANGSFTLLPELPGAFLQSVGRSINARGDVAGQSNGGEPVVWRSGVVQALPMPVRLANTVSEINDSGDVVGTVGSTGVLWRQGQYIPLDPWPGASVPSSVARGINNQGVVVGESYLPAGQGVHAVMWTVAPVGVGNTPPVAAWTVSCQPAPAHICTFNGTGSRDPDGTIVGYRWTNAGGVTLSTLPTFTRTFSRSMTVTWTLTVTDNGGKTGKLTKTFTVP